MNNRLYLEDFGADECCDNPGLLYIINYLLKAYHLF